MQYKKVKLQTELRLLRQVSQAWGENKPQAWTVIKSSKKTPESEV